MNGRLLGLIESYFAELRHEPVALDLFDPVRAVHRRPSCLARRNSPRPDSGIGGMPAHSLVARLASYVGQRVLRPRTMPSRRTPKRLPKHKHPGPATGL